MSGLITSQALVAFAEKAVAEKWGYVLGGQGEMYTRALAERWSQTRRSIESPEYFTEKCARWIGHIVVDCSGLIVQAFRDEDPGYTDRTANTFQSQFVEGGPIPEIPEIPGLAVWRKGHIGIYIGGGYVIEAAGYRWGVVKTPIGKPKGGKAWKEWGKLRDVDYAVEPAEKPVASKPPAATFKLNRLLKYNPNALMRGDDVEELQRVLKAAGFNPGIIDGAYGKRTWRAAIEFQRARKLVPDGIVGAKTAAALGWKWTVK